MPLRLLSRCHPRGIVPRSRHIPGCSNVIEDKLSRRSQVTRQSGPYLRFSASGSHDGPGHMWSFLQPVSITNSPSFVSLVPDPTAWAIDALSPPWENRDVYTFSPVSLLGHIISKVMDKGCHRMIAIAPGWSNMPWILGSGQFCQFRSFSGFLYKGSGDTAL